MEETLDIIISLVVPAILIIFGLTVGRVTEKRHYASLNRREQALTHMLVTDLRTFPSGVAGQRPALLIGEVVIATDYFKTFVATLKKLIGGRLRSYETLVERARREAILRLMEAAQLQGFDAVCNLRLETSDINGVDQKTSKAKATAISVIASGTAYCRAQQ